MPKPPELKTRNRKQTPHPLRTVTTGTRTRLPAFSIAALVGTLAACGSGADSMTAANPTATTEPPTARPSETLDELVPIGEGARLHVRCTGTGDTTVVLISGFEDAGDSWAAVTPAVARETRICSYARFGNGTSDPPPSTQTFSSHAEDLRALLQSIGEPCPYVLVGHSYGGAEAVSFASSFPDEVTGLLLLDASPVTWAAASCAVTDDGSDAARSFLTSCAMTSDPTNNAEPLDVPASFAEVADIVSLGAVPIVVATAADHPFPGLASTETARLNDVWNAGQQHWASLSSSARLIAVDDTSHYIQIDQPGVVIEQIRQLLL